MDDSPPSARSPSARERILLTAHALFYAEGIRATGIDRIIEAAGVTKVTFYRHFPSKHDLILAFLDYRHRRWMAWFTSAVPRHAGGGRSPAKSIAAIVPSLQEWFCSADFRGCAFVNSAVELGSAHADVLQRSRRHKREMSQAIAAWLEDGPHRDADAQAISVAIDGAIVHAQMHAECEVALAALQRLLRPWCANEHVVSD